MVDVLALEHSSLSASGCAGVGASAHGGSAFSFGRGGVGSNSSDDGCSVSCLSFASVIAEAKSRCAGVSRKVQLVEVRQVSGYGNALSVCVFVCS
jgi:hypothetical protein